MRRFFAPQESFGTDSVTLDENETRHLRNVLRLKVGDAANVFDGVGNEFECRVQNIEKRSSILSIAAKVAPMAPESDLDLTICASILKGDKTDFAVQKLVELGVKRFVPMLSARCDVKPKDAAKRVDRWRKIALEAAKQCGRALLMSVDEVKNFNELLRTESDSGGSEKEIVVFSERDGEAFSFPGNPRAITAFLGPEGGWDDAELEQARESRADIITLHGRIMKADTAAVAISAILQHRFGDLN